MSTNSASSITLEGIIRELPEYPRKYQDSPEKKLIIIDEAGEIYDDLPMIRFKKYRFFEVNRDAVLLDVPGPVVQVSYGKAAEPVKVLVSYRAKLSGRGTFSLVRFAKGAVSAHEALNKGIHNAISSFIFDHQDFIINFTQYRLALEELVKKIGEKAGLELWPTLRIDIEVGDAPVEFVRCAHTVTARTRDGQTVDIKHDLALTPSDPVRIALSRISDIQSWAKNKLEQYTNNVIIEMSYADVLVNMQDSVIKVPMQQACREIGYELKQLITVPGLEIEKFYFETVDPGQPGNTEYSTKDVRMKIALNIIVNGRLNLQDEKTKKYIKRDHDIIASLRKMVIDNTRSYINQKSPEECFMSLYELEELLIRMLRTRLRSEYGFKELDITIKFLETDLSKRLSLLQERPHHVELMSDWTERKFVLWFRIVTVSENGWYRFRANNYKETAEEVADIERLIRNGMQHFLLRPPTQIRESNITGEFEKVKHRIRMEFGLEVSLHDFIEELSTVEQRMIREGKDKLEEEYRREKLKMQNKTQELEWWLNKKMEAMQNEEPVEIVKKIEEKIQDLSGPALSKQDFIKQKTGNSFLAHPDHKQINNPGGQQGPAQEPLS